MERQKLVISKKSWHYRLYTYMANLWIVSLDEDPWEGAKYAFRFEKTPNRYPRPKSLCSYFWSIVLCLLGIPLWVLFMFVVGAVTVVVVIVGFPFYYLIMRRQENKEAKLEEAHAAYCRGEISEEEWDEIRDRKKKPNLLLSYLKARKDKHCPLIELKD